MKNDERTIKNIAQIFLNIYTQKFHIFILLSYPYPSSIPMSVLCCIDGTLVNVCCLRWLSCHIPFLQLCRRYCYICFVRYNFVNLLINLHFRPKYCTTTMAVNKVVNIYLFDRKYLSQSHHISRLFFVFCVNNTP